MSRASRVSEMSVRPTFKSAIIKKNVHDADLKSLGGWYKPSMTQQNNATTPNKDNNVDGNTGFVLTEPLLCCRRDGIEQPSPAARHLGQARPHTLHLQPVDDA